MKRLLILTGLVLLAGCGYLKFAEVVDDKSIIEPFSVDFDSEGNLYGVEFQKSNRVFKIDTSGKLTFIAGVQAETNARLGDLGAGDGSDPMQAHFNGMHDLVVGPDGSIYLADTFNARVRKIDQKTGTISTFAGTGQSGFSGDGGPASRAQVAGVYCMSFNTDFSKLYLADLPNRRIRVIDMASGIISTFAGNGEQGVPEEGAIATETALLDPRAVLAGGQGNVFILSRRGHALRVVGHDGRIRTVVNTAEVKGYSGDGGDGQVATMNGPKHLAIDGSGRVLIADTENHCIRRYDPTSGKIHLVAGVPEKSGGTFFRDPMKTEMARPHGSRFHDGWLYISDSENNRLLRYPY